jgi:hypothetical protein
VALRGGAGILCTRPPQETGDVEKNTVTKQEKDNAKMKQQEGIRTKTPQISWCGGELQTDGIIGGLFP